MAYMKRRIKKGKIKINGITLRVVDSGKHVTEGDVWIQAWWRSNGPQLPKYFEIEKNKDGSIPLYKKDNADSTYFRIGEGRIETPAERIEKNDRLKELTQVDASDRPPLKYQMRFTRKQWEAIEWAIDCGISAATTQFSEDKETVALVPVLQSVLDVLPFLILRFIYAVDASDRPPLKYQMRFTRKQWEAIEWAIDCGISAATTQFNEDKETVALVPVLQSVLDEINNRA